MNNKQEKKADYLNKSLSINERKIAYNKHIESIMNPIPMEKFNPKTFEPIQIEDLDVEVSARKREKHIGKLPTYGLEPKKIREGQMIGMFESKQDIYLILAHKINDLEDEMKILKEKIDKNI